MIKIRLARKGKRNSPRYRIVANDVRKKQSGEVLEVLGTWNPKKEKLVVDKKNLDKWVRAGAQVNASVKKLLLKAS